MIITLLIIRGLPGTGKTTLGIRLAGENATFAADDYFTDEQGNYNWNPMKLGEAHGQCFENVKAALISKQFPVVAVTNVFALKKEVNPYVDLVQKIAASLHGNIDNTQYQVFVIDIFDQGMNDENLAESNKHSVPLASIEKMRMKWQH